MVRPVVKCYVAAVFGVVALGLWATQQHAAEQAAKAKETTAPGSLAALLGKSIDVNGFEPNTPLDDAVQFFRDRYDLPLIVDTAAFENEGFDQVEKQSVKLPKMKNVRMSTVLRLLLKHLKAANGDELTGATYLVRSDY